MLSLKKFSEKSSNQVIADIMVTNDGLREFLSSNLRYRIVYFKN